MKATNFEKHVQEKLKGRVISPSASAWERLATQLDANDTAPKIHWYRFAAYAAAAVLLLVWFFSQSSPSIEKQGLPVDTVVETTIDTTSIHKGLQQMLTIENPTEIVNTNQKSSEKAAAKNVSQKKSMNTLVTKPKKIPLPVPIQKANEMNNVIAFQEKTLTAVETNESSSTIKVNSDALLFAVTHSKEEITTYYAKYNVDRDTVLKRIEKQLEQSKLKIDAATILAEVELAIDENTFKNNFMQSIKKRVSDLATAIASRND